MQRHPRPAYIDTHCHLDMAAYKNDCTSVIRKAEDAGVGTIITIGIDLESSRNAVSIANANEHIFATVGMHPHEASKCDDQALELLEQLCTDSKVVGYGEIGLDYVKKYSPQEDQLVAFQQQLEIAKRTGLPVVIHDREAHEDTINILKNNGPYPGGGVLHCFSGDINFAEQVIDLGFYISIPGVVTFKNATVLHQVVKSVDLQHILLETDGPFLAPVPFRGKRNTPDKIVFIARKIAELKNIPVETVAESTTENAIKLFNLPYTTS